MCLFRSAFLFGRRGFWDKLGGWRRFDNLIYAIDAPDDAGGL